MAGTRHDFKCTNLNTLEYIATDESHRPQKTSVTFTN